MIFRLFSFVFAGIFAATFALGQTVPVYDDTSKGYLVGPGDEITGKVLGEDQFDFVSTIDENGNIEIPFFDKPLNVKCMGERELRTQVTKLLSKYLKNPQVSVRITQRNSRPPATVYGEIRTPQQVVLTRKTSLLEILSFSGGATEEAGGTIQVFRTRPPICENSDSDANWAAADGGEMPSRVYSLNALKSGADAANPQIYPGDVVVVQKASPVYITGEVATPQGIYLKEGGLTLTEAIAKIGGVRREAKTKDIKIYRLKPNSKERDVLRANYDLIKKGQQKDIVLEANDIVEVDKAKKSIAQTVFELVTGTARTALGGFGNALPTRVLY